MYTSQLSPGIDRIYKKYVLKIEMFLAFIMITGLALQFGQPQSAKMLTGLSFVALAILYFTGAFQRSIGVDDPAIKIIGYKVLYISWSILLMGLMYTLLNLPGASAMTNIGAISMFFSAGLVVIPSLKSWGNQTTLAILRTLVLAVLLVLVNYSDFF